MAFAPHPNLSSLDLQKLLASTQFSHISIYFIFFVLLKRFFPLFSFYVFLHSLMLEFGLKMNADEFIVQLCCVRLLFIESKWCGIKFETAATTIFTFVRSRSCGISRNARICWRDEIKWGKTVCDTTNRLLFAARSFPFGTHFMNKNTKKKNEAQK